jgi:hypothetical protein
VIARHESTLAITLRQAPTLRAMSLLLFLVIKMLGVAIDLNPELGA